MAIKSPKSKGSSGEREVIALLTSWAAEVGVALKLERNLEQVRYGGSDINGVPGLEVEVKRVEANAINSWWQQVCTAARRTGKAPLLVHRKNRAPWRGRTVVSAAMQNGDRWSLVSITVDLELSQLKDWFQAYIKLHGGNADGNTGGI